MTGLRKHLAVLGRVGESDAESWTQHHRSNVESKMELLSLQELS